MRTVSLARLPDECSDHVIIKSAILKKQHRAQNAIENTLQRCQEIHNAQKKVSEEIKKQKEQEGFSLGFQLYFTTILSMLNTYEVLQQERWNEQRRLLLDAVGQALHDPVVVQHVITELQEHCPPNDVMTLILPDNIPITIPLPNMTLLSTQENHITLQCGARALRFPVEALCQQWMTQADYKTQALTQKLSTLVPSLLQDIIEKLQQIIPDSLVDDAGKE